MAREKNRKQKQSGGGGHSYLWLGIGIMVTMAAYFVYTESADNGGVYAWAMGDESSGSNDTGGSGSSVAGNIMSVVKWMVGTFIVAVVAWQFYERVLKGFIAKGGATKTKNEVSEAAKRGRKKLDSKDRKAIMDLRKAGKI